VPLDCPGRNEERPRDLAVRSALARQLGDPELAGRQRIDSGQNNAARPSAGGAKLRLGLRGEPHCPDMVSDVERLASSRPNRALADAGVPGWSPDDRRVAYAHEGGLAVQAVAGGAVRTIDVGNAPIDGDSPPAWQPG
jgi:hypothetical protein